MNEDPRKINVIVFEVICYDILYPSVVRKKNWPHIYWYHFLENYCLSLRSIYFLDSYFWHFSEKLYASLETTQYKTIIRPYSLHSTYYFCPSKFGSTGAFYCVWHCIRGLPTLTWNFISPAPTGRDDHFFFSYNIFLNLYVFIWL